MRPIKYIWMGICVIVVICWAGIASAVGILLKDVRLGEHEDFTRIVFEFDGASAYHIPEIGGDGVAVVVFTDSSIGTVRPLKGLREQYRLIDSIKFLKNEKHLTATIVARSQNFVIRSFSLVNPDRVVVDLYWSNGTSPVPVIVAAGEPEDRHESAAIREEAALPKTREIEQATTNGNIQPETASRVSRSETAVKTMVQGEISGGGTISNEIGPRMAYTGYDRIQTALMILLVVLNLFSIAILAILTVSVLRWRRWNAFSEGEPVSPLLEDNIISIDTKIQEELKKYKRSR